MKDKTKIRWLTPFEHGKAGKVFDQYGLPVPEPTTSRILGAFDEKNQLVGFVVLQLQIFCEPIWVNEDRRGEGIASKLIDHLLPELEQTDATIHCGPSDNPAVAKLREKLGMESIGPFFRASF